MESVLTQITVFADKAHGDQMRKYSADRYIVHPVRVMAAVKYCDNRLPMLAAALLHDVLEDTPVTRDQMFDFLLSVMDPDDAEQTITLVVEMTDVYVKADYPQWNRQTRKEKELARIVTTSPDAQTIKYADILDNTTEIAAKDPNFAPRYLRECLVILTQADKGNPRLRETALHAVREALAGLR